MASASPEIKSDGTCAVQELGVQFKCDPHWSTESTGTSGHGLVVASADPLVTIGWKKFDQSIRFVGQLNKIFFEKIGLYQDGFGTERVNFAGHDAVLVKGYEKERPDAEHRDYFYLFNDQLVSVSFTLSPKEDWDKGKGLIQKIKDSFTPMP